MAISYHSARRGFLGFLTYITGSDGVARGGVIPAMTLTDSSGTEITSFGGGGASTVADGANVVEGATADAVVAAGAAGTISAKLRRLTTDISAFMAANHTDLTAATPAGTNLIGKVGIDQTTPGTTNGTVPDGGVASGVTDAGKPIKIGGYAMSTAPTAVTNGQRANAWFGLNGQLFVTLVSSGGTVYTAPSDGSDGQTAGNTAPLSTSRGTIFNGTTWDRLKKANVWHRLLSSAATTNANSVKASSGDIFKIIGNNTVASKRYLKLYNKASAPTVGTDTPVLTFVLPASLAFDISISNGSYFSTGIAYAITGAAADADTTAIGAGDIECLNIGYA